MEFSTRQEADGDVTVIECPSRIDVNATDDFLTTMQELVEAGNYRIVLDLDKTEFIDSCGLGALVSHIAATRSNSGDIRLASPGEAIQKLLKITNLDKIFNYFDDVPSAVESYK